MIVKKIHVPQYTLECTEEELRMIYTLLGCLHSTSEARVFCNELYKSIGKIVPTLKPYKCDCISATSFTDFVTPNRTS